MIIPDKSLSLKHQQVRDFIVDRFKIPGMMNARTIAEMNTFLSHHHEILVVLNHDDYNVYVIEQRDKQQTHLTIHRIGLIFTAPFIHPTAQYNYVNMLGCDEIIFNTTFFELNTNQLFAACSINQLIDKSDLWV